MSQSDYTEGRIGDTSGRIGDTSGRSTADVRRSILSGRSDDRVVCLELKVARLEQDIMNVAQHFDERVQGVATLLDGKAGEADLLTLEKRLLQQIKQEITAALRPIEERLRKLETPHA